MRRTYFYLAAIIACAVFLAAFNAHRDHSSVLATDLKSISAITFSREGILFIGDSKSAMVFAVNTKDKKQQKSSPVEIKNLDQKIAAALAPQHQISRSPIWR